MKKHLFKNALIGCITVVVGGLMLQSCRSEQNLLVPHSVSTVGVTTVKDLDLKSGQYQILKTISESASVICEYKSNSIKITSGDGDFSYKFLFDTRSGWKLESFTGAASLGYFTNDFNYAKSSMPSPEEFSRRVAMARIIDAVADLNADGIIEPITVTSASNIGNKKVEYRTTVRAKLISIKTSK